VRRKRERPQQRPAIANSTLRQNKEAGRGLLSSRFPILKNKRKEGKKRKKGGSAVGFGGQPAKGRLKKGNKKGGKIAAL